MQLEVEQKYPVPDHTQLRAQLAALGCAFQAPIEQADLYFQHPARNFKQTDEALRLRRSVTIGSGPDACITYKGPKLDATTKTRREIELPIAGDDGYERHRELLEALGFRAVLEVRKTRTPGTLEWEGTQVEIALDDVAGLGTFIELELLSSPAGLAAAKERLASLAARLVLKDSERRGYIDLLETRRADPPEK
jgi:adenylate cyclase class 2